MLKTIIWSRAADCTHIAAHFAAINNLYCNNSNQLRICADIYVCVLQLNVFAPQYALVLYVKLLFILKYRCAALRRSAAIKQICTAMGRSAAIRGVCAAMRVCSLREIIIYIKTSLRRIAPQRRN